MRTLSLWIFAIVAVFGIPRLANEIRAVYPAAKAPAPIAVRFSTASAKIEVQPAINAGPLPRMASAVSGQKPDAGRLVPVALRPALVPALEASQRPAPPADGQELIAAIQKELNRLGYYDGPASGKWNKAARYGAREFIRRTGEGHVRNPAPSLELLASLKAAGLAKPEAKLDRVPASELPIRQAEFRPKESPAKESVAAPEAAPSDDYLPPWMTRNASAAKPGASAAANSAAPSAASDIAKKVHHRRHRRDYAYSPRWRGESIWGF